MKVLVGINRKRLGNDQAYEMCIVETDEIKNDIRRAEWEDLDVFKLTLCVNISVDLEKFKNTAQNPKEYLKADFDIDRIIGTGRNQNDFQITNIYYDEFNEPQLYRVVKADGCIFMHDVSELEYRGRYSLYGQNFDSLPNFVKKEPLNAAYNWWIAKDEAGKNSKFKFLSGQFEVYDDTPVKLLYHYLTGVKGFKVGYHVVTEISENNLIEYQHEYMLFNGTANVKLKESISNNSDYQIFEYEDKDLYPSKRKVSYYGADMSMICNRQNYPTFKFDASPISIIPFDKNKLTIQINYRNGLLSLYNKLKDSECIVDEWGLDEHNKIFGMTEYNLLPTEIGLLSVRLQNEKENTNYMHVMTASHGHWSTFKTDGWFKIVGIALSIQFYSPELRENLKPIFQAYSTLFSKELGYMIENIGAKDALEVMKWAKKNSKKVLQSINLVKSNSETKKADVGVVEQMSNLFTYKRNNFALPEWLQVYAPETIDALGGIELLLKAIRIKGEESAKKSISLLAEGIESERREKIYQLGKVYINPADILTANEFVDNNGKSKK